MAQPTPTSVETRNVMVVGKTGAGKSTVSNAIVCKGNEGLKFEVSSSFSSCTTNCDHCVVQITEGSTIYKMKVIDTVGLFDTGSLTNEDTIAELKKYLQEHFNKGLNLILFVLKEGRFTNEEKKTFQFLQQNFCDEISAISALVMTSCDMKDELARSKLIQEFRSNELTKPTAEFLKAGIYTVGFPPAEDYESLPAVIKAYQQECIDKDREKLLHLIKQSSEQRLTEELKPVVEKYEEAAVSAWNRCTIL